MSASVIEAERPAVPTVDPAPVRDSRWTRLGNWARGNVALLAIVALALAVRAWDLGAQLPAMYHPDEPTNLRLVERMVANGDLNPHFFNYPSLWFYLHMLVSLDGPLLDWIPGRQPVPLISNVMGSNYAPAVAMVLLHRGLTMLFGVALVVVTWKVAERAWGGRLAPVVAAGSVALSPTLIKHSQFATPDMLATLVVTLAVLAALEVLRTGSTRSYLVAGLLVGLSVSAKYNAVLVAVAVVGAFAVRATRSRPVWADLGRLAMAGAASIVAFVATTPFSLLDRETFMKGIEFERAHYATGHIGMPTGETPRYYVEFLFTQETWIAAAAALGVVLALARGGADRARALMLLAFPVAYGLVVFSQQVHNDRTIMVLLPVLAVFVGYAAQRLHAWGRDLSPRPRGAVLAVAGLAVVSTVGMALPSAIVPSSANDVRVEASDWVADNIPAGSSVVVESYSPWVDPEVYRVTGYVTLVTEPLPDDVDYVIASQAMYGRFVGRPDAFPSEARAYEELFSGLRLVKEFPAGGNSIRIYSVP